MRSTRSRVARPWAVAAPVVAVLALVVATVGATLAAAPSANAATRTLSVSPASALTDQAVTVSWAGFTPTTDTGLNQVIILQCKANPASLADCLTDAPFPSSANGNEVVNGTTRANGTGTAQLEVRPSAQLPALACSQTNPCSVLAFENQVVPAGKLPTLSAIAPITFARSTADCPPVTKFDVRAAGEASGAPVVYNWAARRCTGADPLIIDYTESSSNAGREDFLQRLVDVGITSLAATPAELQAAPNSPKFAYAPADLTALGVVYNLHDPTTNEPITDLTLSPRLLARLITDTDLSTFFQDPELVHLNPHHTWPTDGASTPLLRAESNADTWITTDWIAQNKDAAAFLRGSDPDHVAINTAFKNIVYPTDIFENQALDDAYLPRQGEYQVVTHVFYGARPRDTSPLDPGETGFIGVVDLAAAHQFNLPTAKLVNAAGKAVGPDPASILAGYHTMVAGPDDTLVANPASTDPTAYPLVKVDYAMVPTTTDATHAARIRDLVTWGATDGQSQLTDAYVPLPTALVSRAKTVAAGIAVTKAPAKKPTTHPTTSTTSTTIASTTTLPNSSVGDSSFGGSSFAGSSLGGSGGSSSGGTASGASSIGAAAVAASSPTRGGPHPAATNTTSPVETNTPSAGLIAPGATIAAAGAPLALPALLISGLVAAFVVATRRAWPRLLQPRRTLARILRLLRVRRVASGAV